jgi:hypothetical protein
MPNDKFWKHYCNIQKDVMSFEKDTECDWCGAKENMSDDYTVSIDSFNNKGYKGDDDFQEWLTHEAPFKNVGVSTDSITISSNYNIDDNWQKRMSAKLPIDIMHTLYPKEMKGEIQ